MSASGSALQCRAGASLQPTWQGAVLQAPRPIYSTNGKQVAYAVPFSAKSGAAGYVLISSSKLLGPFIEAGSTPLPSPDAALKAMKEQSVVGLSADSARLIYAGPLFLAYQFELPGPGKRTHVYYHVRAKKAVKEDEFTPSSPIPGAEDSSRATAAWGQVLSPDSSISPMATTYKYVTGVPSYDQANSAHPDSGCGPAAGANVLGYWAQNGYSELQFSSDVSTGVDLMNDLYVDMGSTFAGTTPGGWKNGVQYHANTSHYSPSYYLYNTGDHFTTAQSSTLDGVLAPYNLGVQEINAGRPFGFYIGMATHPDNLLTYDYHFVAGYGYYDNGTSKLIDIQNSWGSSDVIDYMTYYQAKDLLSTIAVRPSK